MRIGIDSDGVLADFDKSMIDGYNNCFGTNLEYKQVTHWDAFEELTGWSHDEWWDWVVRDHPRIFLDAPPLPGALEGVQELKRRGHEICVITAKPKWAAGHMVEWLHEYNVPYDEIHVTSKKIHVACDVYVDDALHNCEAFLKHTDSLVIQYSAWPYVNGGRKVPGAVQCHSWRAVVSAIRAYDSGSKKRDEKSADNIRETLARSLN